LKCPKYPGCFSPTKKRDIIVNHIRVEIKELKKRNEEGENLYLYKKRENSFDFVLQNKT
jgi:hypothetical protein